MLFSFFRGQTSFMHKFVRELITEWRRLKLPFSAETVIVAVSGGADSLSLLLALDELKTAKKLDLRLIVAHFDHGLRGEQSDADATFVKKLAEKLGYELVSEKGELEKTGNLEQNARTARYDFLGRVAQTSQAFAVLTAHTLNDQAETFLINLIRGSGSAGLSAMPKIRPLQTDDGDGANNGSQTLLIRPLLGWAMRDDTENFCREKGVDFRQDIMNDDAKFTRVRVRKELIPMLKAFNPRIISTLAKTAEIISNEDLKIDEKLPETLSLKTLRPLSRSELYKTLRQWIKQYRGNLRGLDLKHIEAIEKLIFSTKSGKTVELPDEMTVVKQNGNLYIGVKSVEN